MKIQVKIKNVYGVERFYPACDSSRLFCKLLQQDTLTRKNVEAIKALNYKIEIIQQRVDI